MKYGRKKFYSDFYKSHFLRDFLFLKANPNVEFDTDSPYLPYDAKLNYNKSIQNFLIKYTNPKNKFHGALISQLTYYKTIGDLRSKDESNRFCNCLFFDFDSDADKLHDLKIEIPIAYDDLTGKSRLKRIAEIHQQYQEILFTSDILEKPFNDAKKLYDFFKSNNIKPYTVFSGSKGVHLYVFFNECKLSNLSEISYKLADSYKSALKLDTLDLNVNKDAIARKSRVIYSKHETSNLFTTPFDIESESITDVLEKSRKQIIEPFNLDNYVITDNNFVNTLKSIDTTVTAKNDKIIAEKKKLHDISNPYSRTINIAEFGDVEIGYDLSDVMFKDMRLLLKVILGEPEREFKQYNTYKCPFHDDKRPSARVYKKNFLCASENLHLNYFEFIRKFYDLESDDDVKEKMADLKNKVMNKN